MTEQSTIRGQSIRQIVSAQDMIAEYQINQKSECVYANRNKIDKVNVDVAKTICARDYKGFGTGFDTMNGVIEWHETENKI